ncbi:protein of unknown function [Pseudodesulfovibrio piezophilus C1TLV30]|uniref:Uncharacterized protein n=1 Tax=Pseudodesulfovibrio piezophilus (strain DSM 21447 / JCM 15486 / C1TLV30) TaxID=1322246 RepID=M1WKG1_PSEP2|nr:protein of unknown function [Pseudodesulfovibrio piezophilus C1TLV30]
MSFGNGSIYETHGGQSHRAGVLEVVIEGIARLVAGIVAGEELFHVMKGLFEHVAVVAGKKFRQCCFHFAEYAGGVGWIDEIIELFMIHGGTG